MAIESMGFAVRSQRNLAESTQFGPHAQSEWLFMASFGRAYSGNTVVATAAYQGSQTTRLA